MFHVLFLLKLAFDGYPSYLFCFELYSNPWAFLLSWVTFFLELALPISFFPWLDFLVQAISNMVAYSLTLFIGSFSHLSCLYDDPYALSWIPLIFHKPYVSLVWVINPIFLPFAFSFIPFSSFKLTINFRSMVGVLALIWGNSRGFEPYISSKSCCLYAIWAHI